MTPPCISLVARIKKTVIFHDYRAATGLPEFAKQNLVYGFNGSGKTTLTRIFASLAEGVLDPRLPASSEFSIKLNDGTLTTQSSNLDRLSGHIRIYNSDFADANFQWSQGQAKPVFYIGKEQADLVADLSKVRAEHEKARAAFPPSLANQRNTENALREFKTATAREIEQELRQSRNYRADSLKKDYESAGDGQLIAMDADELQRQREIVASEAPPQKIAPVAKLDSLSALVGGEVLPVLGKVATNQALAELEAHPSMEGWVRQGHAYHKTNKLDICLLCQNPLTPARLELLEAAFDNAYQALLNEIRTLKGRIEGYSALLESLPRQVPEQTKLAPPASQAYEKVRQQIELLTEKGNALLAGLKEAISIKEGSLKSVFTEKDLPNFEELDRFDVDAAQAVTAANSMVALHNEYHDGFVKIRDAALKAVKSHHLALNLERYNALASAATKAESDHVRIVQQGKELAQRVKNLDQKLKSHAPAAKHISKLVNNFLSHQEICIEPVDDGYELRRRDGSVMTNLSEGEKRAITFCYFLSTLHTDGKGPKDFIVLIDDPISSLDSRALNYTSSLIRQTLAEAGQLFILTHNLHFMHEIRKWIAPKNLINKVREEGGTIPLYFLEVRQSAADVDRSTSIVALPVLLREHESEYHYLFSIVHACADSSPAATEFLYLMPNAMRKVLEIFLCFKVPGGGGLTSQLRSTVIRKRIDQAKGDLARFNALERLAEIESHGDSLDAIAELPFMTVEETHRAAKALLELIELCDEDHSKQMAKLCSRQRANVVALTEAVQQPAA